MCGRYTLTCTTEELESIFELIPGGYHEERRYNLAPGQWVIVIRPDQERRRIASRAQWGLVPRWAKAPGEGPRPINARVEGLAQKPVFRDALRQGRCLVPASGYYEWKGSGRTKQPFYIHTAEPVFAFAGLHSIWTGAEGILPTCAILTTTPNAALAPLHDRMPVILPRECWSRWLDPATPLEAALEGLGPRPIEGLAFWAVAPRVGDVRQDDPALVEPLPDPLIPDGAP